MDTKKYGLTDLTKDELMHIDGGKEGDAARVIGKIWGGFIAVMEYIGKHTNEYTPGYAQGK